MKTATQTARENIQSRLTKEGVTHLIEITDSQISLWRQMGYSIGQAAMAALMDHQQRVISNG
jgi:hypothetical protein